MINIKGWKKIFDGETTITYQNEYETNRLIHIIKNDDDRMYKYNVMIEYGDTVSKVYNANTLSEAKKYARKWMRNFPHG